MNTNNKDWNPFGDMFSRNDDNDGGRTPQGKPQLPFRINRPLWIGLLLLLAVTVALPAAARFLTDYLWFEARGFTSVFWTRLLPQWALFGTVGVISFLLLWLNLRRAKKTASNIPLPEEIQSSMPLRQPFMGKVLAGICVLLAMAIGSGSMGNWETVLRFLHRTSFGSVDPIFGHDIGFYVFQLPLYMLLQKWLLSIIVIGLVGSGFIYLFTLLPGLQIERRLSIPRQVRVHLSLQAALIALVWASGFWLQRFYLLYSRRGVAFGASYTDIHADLLALTVMAVLTFLVALLLIVGMYRKTLKFSIGLVVMLVAVNVVLRGFYPGLIQKYVVEPNEFAKETPYIDHNIAGTLRAYDLDKLNIRTVVPENEVTPQEIQDNGDTIRNIRLWDYNPLLRSYKQLQEIRSYYDFVNVDIDRYNLNGSYRQSILAARELDLRELQNPTWVNVRLEFTHGYGIVMNPVNEVSESGLPILWVKDLPPHISVPLEISHPQIYFGEKPSTYAFVKTSVKEFDYPMGDSNVRSTYEGRGGVSIGSIWRRLLYSISFRDSKIFFTDVFKGDSRVLYHRNIRNRLNHVAPFLEYDSDPYLTIIDGRLMWIQDCYTTSDRYPYSEPVNIGRDSGNYRRINYIRNSVKATVDAYDGTMTFYVADPTDPLIHTWQKIFPGLFTPMEKMPATLRAHLRYPRDLFSIQSEIYRTYHMKNSNTFYNKEDVWDSIKGGEERGGQASYYMVMKLAGEKKAEFMLIAPFLPVGRDNMIAWLAARCDGDNYGQLVVYKFPKQKLLYGPAQVAALVNQNPEISAQLSLWSQRGSDVIRGNMLVIPLGKSLLYVQPLYLRAETSDLPELKRVIVSTGGRVAWDRDLDGALKRLFGSSQESMTPREKSVSTEIPGTLESLATMAQLHWKASQEALREGNWARYGEEMSKLEAVLQQMASPLTDQDR